MKFKKGMVVCTRYSHMNTEIIYSEKYKGVRAQRKKYKKIFVNEKRACQEIKRMSSNMEGIFFHQNTFFSEK